MNSRALKHCHVRKVAVFLSFPDTLSSTAGLDSVDLAERLDIDTTGFDSADPFDSFSPTVFVDCSTGLADCGGGSVAGNAVDVTDTIELNASSSFASALLSTTGPDFNSVAFPH